MTGRRGISLAEVHEAIAARHPDRECIVWRDRRLSWASVTDRSRRFAGVLTAGGLGAVAPRETLAAWQAGQDTMAVFCFNGNEYLEAMLGAYKARVAPVNVNFRYTPTELAYVVNDAAARALAYDASLGPVVAAARPAFHGDVLLVEVGGGDETTVAGALAYEAALAAHAPRRPEAYSSDDLYVLYTGGTTGQPKGVLWRQSDFVAGALGITATADELVGASDRGERLRVLPSPPLMHGAAQWYVWSAWLAGGTVVMQDDVHHVDPADVLAVIRREGVGSLQIVGDSFARPLVDRLRAGDADVPTLRFLVSGGAVLSASVKAELLALLPDVRIIDIVGSSEAGRQGVQTSTRAAGASSGTFDPSYGATVLDEARRRVLPPGSPDIGWLATSGFVPLGYLGDPDKTAETFPVVDGVRYSVPGDRARRGDDGSIVLLGRDAATVNSGGEKIFAEEVETVLKAHPAVYDALVVGRPSARWGQEVVAVVHVRADHAPTDDDLRSHCAGELARYKIPKAFVRREFVQRSPSGKPDYAWARQQLSD
jgi:fatty-acyl-CoA synthase